MFYDRVVYYYYNYYRIFLILLLHSICEQDLALNNLQGLIYSIKQTNQPTNQLTNPYGVYVMYPLNFIYVDFFICQINRENEKVLNIILYTYIRGLFKKFPAFFVQAFKIVVDSWKFSMLLLYILWNDWPIFMISGSKEQLQQQLEYILLKPDCHSWWISKMQSGREDTLEERYAIKLCFKLGKNATKLWNASDCFWTSLHESSISFWVA